MSDMKLLSSFETFDYSAEMMKESLDKTGKILMKGILQKADTLNQNGRIYPLAILEREVRNYQKFIIENRALGELDHPDTSVVNLKNASHVVREAYIENGTVLGTIEVLHKTPSGAILKGLIESGVKLGISSRGVGSTRKQNDYYMVQDDFQLICWDMVSEPSTPGAFMIPEGKTISSQELQEVFNRSDRIDRILNDILSKLGTRTMLDNPKIGTSFAAEFSSSALPWVTSSVAPATGSPTRFNFQKVSRFVIVSNLDATPANSMSIGFTRLGITTSNNKLVIPGGQTVTLELRVKEIYVQGEGGTPNFSILAGLTNVEAGSMGVLTGSGGTGWSGVG